MLLENVDHHLAERDRDQGNSLGTLPHNLVTANKGKSCVPSHDGDGEVKCGNDTDIADWVPNLHHEVAWSL